LNFENACVSIAQQIIGSRMVPQAILGLQRGGLMMAVRLSHLLTVPMTDSLRECVSPCLIVDDIADTGFALQRIVGTKSPTDEDYDGLLPKVACFGTRIATWHRREGTAVEPDYYYADAEDYNIVYPWELPTIRRIL